MNEEEFGRAALRHRNRVHTHAMWLTRNADDAVETTQEALMRLWQHRKRVPSAAAKSWLIKTVHHLSIDRLKAHQRRERNDNEPDQVAAVQDFDNTDRRDATDDLRRKMGNALAELPPRDRGIILMREFHGMTYDEISSALELPMGTVKATLHRARHRLRGELITAGAVL